VTHGPGPTTGRSKHTDGSDQWEYWWEANSAPLLQLQERLRRLVVRTEAASPLNRSRNASEPRSRLNSDDVDRVEKALLAALPSSDPDVADAAVLALARTVPAERASEVLPAIVQTLGHEGHTAREAATLALGVLGAPDGAAPLRELLLDSEEGRRLTRQGVHVEERVRAFAAASLGMLGDPADVARLERVVTDDSLHATSDLKALAVLSLGLVKGAHEQIVPFLVQTLSQRNVETLVRAQAPIALARLSDQPTDGGATRAALSRLVDMLQDAREETDLRRSIAIALGRVANVDDDVVVGALVNTLDVDRDVQTRFFATIALGELVGRDAEPDRHAAAQKRVVARLVKELQSPTRPTAVPYAALALALWGRNEAVDSRSRDAVKEKLHAAFLAADEHSLKAGCAVALGVVGASDAKPDLWHAFEDSKDPALRGYVAVALGLLFDVEHSPMLREALTTPGASHVFKLQIARSLGLMGDPKAIPALLDEFTHAETLYEISSSAQALGLVGDRRAVDGLVKVLEDRAQPAQRRGFAAAGLGLLGEKSDLPWNAIFEVASNYRAKTPSLAEIFDLL
jgi:HEAT repeat protein